MKKPVNVQYKPLSPACGAEILGVNLRENLPQATIDEIREFGPLIFGNYICDDTNSKIVSRVKSLLRKIFLSARFFLASM